jgi:hypothetical protein
MQPHAELVNVVSHGSLGVSPLGSPSIRVTTIISNANSKQLCDLSNAMKWATTVRILRRAAVSVLVLVLLLGATLRIQSYLFRRQAEHLMADFQTLKLRQTRWPEAENLTRKWGKYGHYQGKCNASFCRYTIALGSPEIKWLRDHVVELDRVSYYLTALRLFNPASRFLGLFGLLVGSRPAVLTATFVVQDAIVLRKSAVFIYDVPPFFGSEGGYQLIATSRATSRLSSDEYLLTYSDQLVKHPYYMYSRPGGCSSCLMANVSFTPDAPESEITWLTTFNLACLTNFMPCRYLEEIYPASEDWHLYDGTLGGRPGSPNQVNSEQPANSMECRIPVFALGREAAKIISVTSLKESQEQHPDEVDEKATVRFNSLLKGSAKYDPGESIDVISRSYNIRNPLKMQPPLTPGEHLLLLSQYFEKEARTMELSRCLVLPDTPEIRAEIQRGMAQIDRLRFPDRNAGDFIPY